MDTTVDSGNLLLLASLSSYVSAAAADGISIIGKVADSSMVSKETVEIGEIKDVVNLLLVVSVVFDVSAVDVPPLVLKKVFRGGADGRGVTDPLLPPEGVA